MPLSIKIYFFAVLALLAWCIFEMEYEAIKNYYPSMTRLEYLLLSSKLRVTPNGINECKSALHGKGNAKSESETSKERIS